MRTQRLRIGLGCLWALALGVSACGRPVAVEPALRLAVSIPPQAWLVEQVGGERVAVLTLLQPGSSHETYLPTDQQVSEVMTARAYLRIGVPFENGVWFDALQSAGQVRIVDQRQGLALRPLEGHVLADGAAAGEPDPHVWLSPPLLQVQARGVAGLLAELDPAGQSYYQARLADLDARLSALHGELQQQLAPLAGRSFVVFHPSWGYFADTYGLHQLAIEMEGKQPSDAELTAVQRRALAAGLKVVFVQPQITGKAAAAVADTLGGRIEVVDPLAPDVIANLRQMAQKVAASYPPP